MINIGYYKSPIGIIKIKEEDGYIVAVDFVEKAEKENLSETILECKGQLEEYFKGERNSFDVKIKFTVGTEFQKRVWNELINIDYGKIASYKDIAEKVGSPKGFRAVGGANNKNPISIIVPCHRVVGANGKMVGYAGGVDKKVYLLELEKSGKFK
ncbi:methylated-DNA--[protein]-cysteine S-methyltransferase [Clostridium paraputrificum]|uniref:methylated-DNA--[protein]-cysteine S-methyltransferase n=1 Tax=Clostridium TaxID=1485 RepID=UPI003D34E1EC